MAVCVISFPSHLYSRAYVQKVEHLSDWVVKFKAFSSTGSKVTEAFQDFDGQFFVKKLPHLYSLTSPLPETVNYVFKLKRRKLHIEIPHLGPTETRSSAEKTVGKKSSKEAQQPKPKETTKSVTDLLCQPGPKRPSNIDF